jgi:hypothetical protein
LINNDSEEGEDEDEEMDDDEEEGEMEQEDVNMIDSSDSEEEEVKTGTKRTLKDRIKEEEDIRKLEKRLRTESEPQSIEDFER